MAARDSEIAVVLIARRHLYQLFQRIFGGDPDGAMLEALADRSTLEVFGLYFEEDDEALETFNGVVSKVAKDLADAPDDLLGSLNDEYTRLFIGPLQLPAPPWESVYVTEERTLFQACTLKVRKAYLKHHFLPSNYPHEADDHLAIELDFMAHLADRSLELLDAADYGSVERLLLDQLTFLREHPLVWAADFAASIQDSKTHLLYPHMAEVAVRFLETDATALEELLRALQEGDQR